MAVPAVSVDAILPFEQKNGSSSVVKLVHTGPLHISLMQSMSCPVCTSR